MGTEKVSKAREKILIVASGPSLRAIDPHVVAAWPVWKIAVNGAGFWLPWFSEWFSLDPSEENVKTAKALRALVPEPHINFALPSTHPGIPNTRRLLRVTGDLFGRNRAPGGLAEHPELIHTGNSVFGALGLAYHYRPRRVAILGLDGTQDEKITGGFCRDLSHLPDLFRTAIPQLERAGIEVVNGSPQSAVMCFPRMSPEDALEWLTQ